MNKQDEALALRQAMHHILTQKIRQKYVTAAAFAAACGVTRQHTHFVMNKSQAVSVGIRPLMVLANALGMRLSTLIAEAETYVDKHTPELAQTLESDDEHDVA